MAVTAGTKLGHYEILSFIGKSGMWEVWRSWATKSLHSRKGIGASKQRPY